MNQVILVFKHTYENLRKQIHRMKAGYLDIRFLIVKDIHLEFLSE